MTRILVVTAVGLVSGAAAASGMLLGAAPLTGHDAWMVPGLAGFLPGTLAAYAAAALTEKPRKPR